MKLFNKSDIYRLWNSDKINLTSYRPALHSSGIAQSLGANFLVFNSRGVSISVHSHWHCIDIVFLLAVRLLLFLLFLFCHLVVNKDFNKPRESAQRTDHVRSRSALQMTATISHVAADNARCHSNDNAVCSSRLCRRSDGARYRRRRAISSPSFAMRIATVSRHVIGSSRRIRSPSAHSKKMFARACDEAHADCEMGWFLHHAKTRATSFTADCLRDPHFLPRHFPELHVHRCQYSPAMCVKETGYRYAINTHWKGFRCWWLQRCNITYSFYSVFSRKPPHKNTYIVMII